LFPLSVCRKAHGTHTIIISNAMISPEIRALLAAYDQAYDRKSWHGTNLRGSLRGLSAKQAAWRPAKGRHNIWEIALHAAYWKYVVLRVLSGAKRGSFPLQGSNWFVRPKDPTDLAWKADLALLEATHRSLREAIAAIDPKTVSRAVPGRQTTRFALISGVAAHDLYHAGQIQLLKRFAPKRRLR
jgi:uncharacterized damage-inducible protein DinB